MSVADRTRLLEWGRERVRVGPWRGDPTVAYVNPVPGVPLPSTDFVRRIVRTLGEQGYRRAVTGALAPAEQTAFRAVGFAPAEHLHLLAHDLRGVPVPPALPVTLRRAVRTDRAAVLDVDARAFDAFWRLRIAWTVFEFATLNTSSDGTKFRFITRTARSTC